MPHGAAHRPILLAGNANPQLAADIAEQLAHPLAQTRISRFADGEIRVEILENLRGRDVYLLQPTCPPVNENLMELLILADACRRASAASITAVVPYFGYARQDRKSLSRSPITAKLVADMIQTAGIDRLMSIDLHSGQLQGFFNIPVDNLYGELILDDDIAQQFAGQELVIVSPDVGGVLRARAMAKKLQAPLAIIDKRRPDANQSEVLHIIGDVKGRVAVIVDDMIDTAGTVVKAAEALKKAGAKAVHAYATHGVFSGEAASRLSASVLGSVVVTDTLPQTAHQQAIPQLRVLPAAPLLAQAINRVTQGQSLSALFA